jgi:hypothetical protein
VLSFLFLVVFPSYGRTRTAPSSTQNIARNKAILSLGAERSSRLDLESSSNLAASLKDSEAHLRRKDLSLLPQVAFTISNDARFTQPVKLQGVELQVLARDFAANGKRPRIVVISSSNSSRFYPQTYREIHRPGLVFEGNGQPASSWPMGIGGNARGTYLVRYAKHVEGTVTCSAMASTFASPVTK